MEKKTEKRISEIEERLYNVERRRKIDVKSINTSFIGFDRRMNILKYIMIGINIVLFILFFSNIVYLERSIVHFAAIIKGPEKAYDAKVEKVGIRTEKLECMLGAAGAKICKKLGHSHNLFTRRP